MRILRGNALPAGRSTAAILLAAICTAGSGPASAAIDLSAGASVGIEHSSNPYQIGDAEVLPFVASGDTNRGDTLKRFSATVAAVAGGNGPTHMSLRASFSRVTYDRFDTLAHNEYSVGGTLDWRPSQVFDVSLQASQNRVPAVQADITTQEAALQTSQVVEGTLRVRVTPRWQIGLTPGWRHSDLPQPNGQSFDLRETSGKVSLDYLGVGPLVPGVAVNETRGRYSGIANATRYTDQTVQGTLNYKLSDFSSFALAAGYTQRSTHLIVPSNDPLAQINEGTTPALTGSLTVQRRLTPKTNLTFGAFRDFQQYDSGVNTTVGTGFVGGITWTATTRLSVTAGSQFTWSSIDGAPFPGPAEDRTDLVRTYAVSVSYAATQRVSLRTYITRSTRDSTIRSALFNGTTAGLELTTTFD